MPVYKRNPGLDADDYVSGATVRRSARSSVQEPSTRRVPDNRAELFPSRQSPATQRRSVQNANIRPQRRTEPLRDTRSFQDRRRADPPRAYYSRGTRHPAPHPAPRSTTAPCSSTPSAVRSRSACAASRRSQQRETRKKRAAAVSTASRRCSLCEHRAGGRRGGRHLSLLVRYTQIEQMIVEQRKLTAEIDNQQKRLEGASGRKSIEQGQYRPDSGLCAAEPEYGLCTEGKHPRHRSAVRVLFRKDKKTQNEKRSFCGVTG